jgi:TonB family protein
MNTTQTRSLARIGSRAFLLALIAGAHVIVGMSWLRNPIGVRTMSVPAEPMFAEMFAAEPPLEPVRAQSEAVPNEPVDIPVPDLPTDALALADEPTIQAPQIDPLSAPNISAFAERADLHDGKKVTVMLMISVGVDGSVISAQIVRSNGEASANTAALDYARATRWIPGTIDGQPQAMEASLTVILGERV